MSNTKPIIQIKGLGTCFNDTWVHKNLNLTIMPNKITAIIGGSGSGKTTLIRAILMLQEVVEGEINILGQNITNVHGNDTQRRKIACKVGMMFQSGALFGALTALDNVMFPLQEYSKFSQDVIIDLARLKLSMTGLPEDAYNRYPS